MLPKTSESDQYHRWVARHYITYIWPDACTASAPTLIIEFRNAELYRATCPTGGSDVLSKKAKQITRRNFGSRYNWTTAADQFERDSERGRDQPRKRSGRFIGECGRSSIGIHALGIAHTLIARSVLIWSSKQNTRGTNEQVR